MHCMPFISGFILLFFWDKNSLISRLMDILLRYHLHFFGYFLQWPTLRIVKLVLSSQSAISREWPLNTGFFSVIVASHTIAQDCVEKNRKKKTKKERERERAKRKKEKRIAIISLRCKRFRASSSRMLGWEQKRGQEWKGRRWGEKETSYPLPSSFFHFVLLSFQLWRNDSIGNACYAG